MARIAKPWFYKRTGWWMAWINGERVPLAEGRGNKKQAQTRLLELRLEVSKNPAPDCAEQTVASVVESYLELAGKHLATNTLTVKRIYLQSFAEQHGWRLVTEAKKLHLTQWLDKHPEWASDWTLSHALSVIQAAFNWAAKEQLIDHNPFRGKSHREGKPRRPLTRDEFQSLLRASGGQSRRRPSPGARFRQLLVFLWYTGARPDEAARLVWSDVNFDQAIIVLIHHKTSRTQKTPKPRIIPLHPVVLKLLASIHQSHRGDRVFQTHRGTPWNKNNLGLRVRRARKKADIPADAKLYGTRHAFGTRAIVGGVDIKTIAELMGHTTTRMTEHYLHLASQHAHLAAAMRQANAARRGA